MSSPPHKPFTSIQKAYRRLAIQFHPDKNPGNEEASSVKFKEIAAAYEILSDPEKKQRFDRFGHADQGGGLGGGGGFHADHIDPFEVFQAFFGGGYPDMFNQMGGGANFHTFGGPGFTFHMGGRPQPRRQQPRSRHAITLTLEEIYKGGTKRVNGEEITIPKGVAEGQVIQGSQSTYVIQEVSHNFFTRSGTDLSFTAILPFFDWLLNGRSEFSIAHLDGSVVKTELKPFVETLLQPSAVVSGKGMRTVNGVGNLLVYSSFLTRQQRQQAMGVLRVIGTFFLMMLVMTNPSLLFLVLLLKPLFS
jgi:DnaJ-class molecular chaperone